MQSPNISKFNTNFSISIYKYSQNQRPILYTISETMNPFTKKKKALTLFHTKTSNFICEV